jgi:hypothetical protein
MVSLDIFSELSLRTIGRLNLGYCREFPWRNQVAEPERSRRDDEKIQRGAWSNHGMPKIARSQDVCLRGEWLSDDVFQCNWLWCDIFDDNS